MGVGVRAGTSEERPPEAADGRGAGAATDVEVTSARSIVLRRTNVSGVDRPGWPGDGVAPAASGGLCPR